MSEWNSPPIASVDSAFQNAMPDIYGSAQLIAWVLSSLSKAPQVVRRLKSEIKRLTPQKAGSLITSARDKSEELAIEIRGDNLEQVLVKIKQGRDQQRQARALSIFSKSEQILKDKMVPDQEINHDLAGVCFDCIQEVSDDQVANLWARMIAGELQRPGTFSIRTLRIMRDFDRNTATLFETFCSHCIFEEMNQGQYTDGRMCALGLNPGENGLRKYGLSFTELSCLTEHGLMRPGLNGWSDYKAATGIHMGGTVLLNPLRFQGDYYALIPKDGNERDSCKIVGPNLTEAGRQIASLAKTRDVPDYANELRDYFQKQALAFCHVGKRGMGTISEEAWRTFARDTWASRGD